MVGETEDSIDEELDADDSLLDDDSGIVEEGADVIDTLEIQPTEKKNNFNIPGIRTVHLYDVARM